MINGGVKEKNVFVSVAGKSTAAARENLKRKQKDALIVLKWHTNVLKCRIFRHFRQEIIAYFS